MSVVEDRGGADALAQMLTTKHDAEHGPLNRVGDNEYDPEGFFDTARMQKYVPPWAEGALPGYVVNQLKDEKHRSLVETLSETMSSALRTDESSWAHSTGSGTKPPAWHVNIHGAPPDSVEEALQTSSDPPKKKVDIKSRITRKEMQERWERKLRYGGPDAKKGELRSLQAIQDEFRKHGARNLNKFELDQLHKDEEHRMEVERHAKGWTKEHWDRRLKDHGGKTPREVKGQGVYGA